MECWHPRTPIWRRALRSWGRSGSSGGNVGDAIWSVWPLMAIPWLTAMGGCPIQRNGENVW